MGLDIGLDSVYFPSLCVRDSKVLARMQRVNLPLEILDSVETFSAHGPISDLSI